MSIRTERVASLLKEEIGAMLVRDYNDPAYGFITVTDVRVTGDLRIAKMHVQRDGNARGAEEDDGDARRQERSHIRGHGGVASCGCGSFRSCSSIMIRRWTACTGSIR